jgi:hypothetical protein
MPMFHVVFHGSGRDWDPARLVVAAIDPWSIRLDRQTA